MCEHEPYWNYKDKEIEVTLNLFKRVTINVTYKGDGDYEDCLKEAIDAEVPKDCELDTWEL